MSRDVSIFFSLPDASTDWRELMRQALSLTFGDATATSPPRAICAGFDFAFIEKHDLEDNLGIPFSRFAFQLSVEPVNPGVAGSFDAQTSLALYLASLLRQRGIDCLVVDDVQRILDVVEEGA